MQPGEWKNYRGKWHGSYYMIDWVMYAHVTKYNDMFPNIVLRLPSGQFIRWNTALASRDMEVARTVALRRLAVIHPHLFAQRELEV